jgi:hypothetical protein
MEESERHDIAAGYATYPPLPWSVSHPQNKTQT